MSTRLERQGRRNARYIDKQTDKIYKLRPNGTPFGNTTKPKKKLNWSKSKGPNFIGA